MRRASGASEVAPDSVTGQRLWYATDNNGADLNVAKMNYSIPADIKVVDLDGDGRTAAIIAGTLIGAAVGGAIGRSMD